MTLMHFSVHKSWGVGIPRSELFHLSGKTCKSQLTSPPYSHQRQTRSPADLRNLLHKFGYYSTENRGFISETSGHPQVQQPTQNLPVTQRSHHSHQGWTGKSNIRTHWSKFHSENIDSVLLFYLLISKMKQYYSYSANTHLRLCANATACAQPGEVSEPQPQEVARW